MESATDVPLSSTDAQQLDRTLRSHSRLISAVYIASCIYGIAVFFVLLMVFALTSSNTLPWDRRIILGVLFGVFLLSSLTLLYLSRHNGKVLLILCPVITHITGIALGLCAWYL